MSASNATYAPPSRLLLATDLSSRCDRALDRAAQLAAEWQAELVALNVLDVAATPDQALAWATGADDHYALTVARQQLARDLTGLAVRATMRLERAGDAATAVRDVAASTGSGIVVTGVARNEFLGDFLLGSTVERLARSLPQPLLVVRNRVRGPYQRIAVATDFSESSRHALLATARLFPGRDLILYHACQNPPPGRPDNPPPARPSRDIEQGEYADFMAASGLSANVTVRPAIEHGALETTLTRYVRSNDIDLVAIGSHGRGGVMSVLLGSSAAKLLDWLPCDVLVVREPRATA